MFSLFASSRCSSLCFYFSWTLIPIDCSIRMYLSALSSNLINICVFPNNEFVKVSWLRLCSIIPTIMSWFKWGTSWGFKKKTLNVTFYRLVWLSKSVQWCFKSRSWWLWLKFKIITYFKNWGCLQMIRKTI